MVEPKNVVGGFFLIQATNFWTEVIIYMKYLGRRREISTMTAVPCCGV